MAKYDQDELLLRVSEFFKALSDYSRMKIVYALLNGELCVNDIVKEVNMTQTAVSYQLKLLRQLHLVKYRRVGQNVFYSIDDEHVHNIIKMSIDHIEE
ncbi:MAG: metalloregulator ArsR/SmtB family transcription factor [Bacilli bacterium]|nr:metalloregulator ArsR/SmtB family transcription factor [Bacillales bacterium]MDY2574717.1 metalloregulator ArsR/SmtB family transcription factor [Bacilli bacterium]